MNKITTVLTLVGLCLVIYGLVGIWEIRRRVVDLEKSSTHVITTEVVVPIDQLDLLDIAVAEAKAADVPPPYFVNLVSAESAWNAEARGLAGEIGLCQIMSAAAVDVGITGWETDQKLNLRVGARYLRLCYDRTHGDWWWAAVAYNWGIGNVGKARGDRLRVPEGVRKYADKIVGAGK